MKMNDEQLLAVRTDALNIVIVAGPGSGKTRTLIARILQDISTGIRPERIVVITFTNAAADEIRERLTAELHKDPAQAGKYDALLPDGTLNLGYCGTLHGWLFGLLRKYHGLIGLRSRLTVIDEATSTELLEDILKETRSKYSLRKVKEELHNHQLLLDKELIGVKNAAAEYLMRLKENGLMDFDAILTFGIQLLSQLNITLGAELMVDEYQDSGDNDALIYSLARFDRKIFVGDPDQSIYRFRGGNPKLIAKEAMSPKSKLFRIQLNFRSVKEICFAANDLIANNPGRIEKLSIHMRDEVGSVQHFGYISEAMQLSAIKDKIAGLLVGEPSNAKEIAVICQNNWMVHEVANTLKAAGLPVVEKRRTDEPKDWSQVRLLIAFFCNPENDLIAYKFARWTRGEFEADRAKCEAARAMCSINSLLTHVGEVELDEIPQTLTVFGIGPESRQKVNETIGRLKERSLNALSMALSEAVWTSETEEVKNGVTVCTIHGSKGREWSVVFLPYWNQENFPGKKAGEDLEEERRKAFVALTRVKDTAIIMSTQTTRRYEKQTTPEPAAPSQFITECGLKGYGL